MLTNYFRPLDARFPLDLLDSHFGGEVQEFKRFKPMAIDIREHEDNYEIVADVPGVEKDQVNIQIKDHVLTISYERNEEKTTENSKYHRVERFTGSASRSVQLPRDVDTDKVEAFFKNGVVDVKVPKIAPVQPKKIELQDKSETQQPSKSVKVAK